MTLRTSKGEEIECGLTSICDICETQNYDEKNGLAAPTNSATKVLVEVFCSSCNGVTEQIALKSGPGVALIVQALSNQP